jgi:hypothetical protein
VHECARRSWRHVRRREIRFAVTIATSEWVAFENEAQSSLFLRLIGEVKLDTELLDLVLLFFEPIDVGILVAGDFLE